MPERSSRYEIYLVLMLFLFVSFIMRRIYCIIWEGNFLQHSESIKRYYIATINYFLFLMIYVHSL